MEKNITATTTALGIMTGFGMGVMLALLTAPVAGQRTRRAVRLGLRRLPGVGLLPPTEDDEHRPTDAAVIHPAPLLEVRDNLPKWW